MTEQAVTNTACLIALEALGRMELLPALFRGVAAPPEVIEEFGSRPPWLTVRPVSFGPLLLSLQTQLHLGEAAAIALAIESNAHRVILDDRKARRVASQMGVGITGTVGLVIRAKVAGLIPEARLLIDELEGVGFRMSPTLRATALRLAGEAT